MRFPRSSGILLHLTSLGGPYGCGDLGGAAYRFADWLTEAGQTLWQMLPVGPVGPGNSPYMSTSAFAGNPLLVDLDDLVARGWLLREEIADPGFPALAVDYSAVTRFRMTALERAAARFTAGNDSQAHADFEAFRSTHGDWLDDYALFMAIEERYPGRTWMEWPRPLATRAPEAIAAVRKDLAGRISFWLFVQWRFFRQWAELKAYTAARGIRLIGDIPIFVALHGAETWARPDLFELGPDLRPTSIAGVPPDFFSATGQRWGNPLYRWDAMAREGFAWWIHRIRRTFELVDIARVDHFRGFAGYWSINADEPTAVNGRWLEGPGAALFSAIEAACGPLPIIAEDLGVITPDVVALREQFAFPGMRVLQFAFDGDPRHPFLPHNFDRNTVVYTGTHDNDTTCGWFAALDEATRRRVLDYLDAGEEDIHWHLIRAASASVADLAIFPLQDVLGLGGEARMNLPGLPDGYWRWRIEEGQVDGRTAARLRATTERYARRPQ